MIDEYQLDEDNNMYRIYSDKKKTFTLNNPWIKFSLIFASIFVLLAVIIIGVSLLAYMIYSISYLKLCLNSYYCQPRIYQNAAVASDSVICSQIGSNILQMNGNAADAAVAVAICLGVVSPVSSGIGGGGSAVLYFPQNSKPINFYDFRETAPLNAYKDMYNSNPLDAQRGVRAIAVPGEIKGLKRIFDDYGSKNLEWKDLIQPSINLTRNGVAISKHMASAILRYKDIFMSNFTGLKELYYFEDQQRWAQTGDIVKYPKLGDTLEQIAADPDSFYNGNLAQAMVNDIQRDNGILNMTDFQNYTVDILDPIKSFYHGYEIYGGQPEISGGPCIALALNILERYNVGKVGFTKESVQKIIEAMKFMFGYRLLLGDRKYVNLTEIIPEMISKDLASTLRSKIVNDKTFNATFYQPPGVGFIEYDSGTTHFSIIDKDRNAIALTSTVNLEFGSFYISNSTGIILNDEMDDFSIPGRPNAFNMPPSENNYIVPGKRPLSSQSPTIVLKDGNVDLVVGGSGGPRIISATYQVIIYSLDFEMNVAEAVNSVRVHHQLYPLILRMEEGYPFGSYLSQIGHQIDSLNQKDGFLGVTQAVKVRDDGQLEASSDFRKGGDTSGY